MEGPEGIEASWRFASYALRNGAGCAIHLSNLRHRGSTNEHGLVASGPVSFARIYSALNETLRRGGIYKNGAVVLHLDATHPDLLEFINTPRAQLPWVKRCVDVEPDFLDELPTATVEALLEGIKRGDIWLSKIKYDERGQRIYGNVCLEVYLPSRGTCLLQHVNLGQCKVEDLPQAFEQGMKELVKLHANTGVDKDGIYLSPERDRQVGLGVLGFANFLAQEGVTYKEFARAYDRYYEGTSVEERADQIVAQLAIAIRTAERVARWAGMERAFCIAPTANCSYKSTDLRGYTCVPEIAPPISRSVDRDSGTFGVQPYDYPPDCEIARDVGWTDYKQAADAFVHMLEETGLFHGYSFNSWSDVVTYDRKFLEDWNDSPQTSLYYSLQVSPDTQSKDTALAALNEDFHELFKFGEIDTTTPQCDDTFCSACSE